MHIGEVTRRVAADGITFGVALFIAISAQFQALGRAPFLMKDGADKIKNRGRTDGDAKALRHDRTRTPILINQLHEGPQGSVVVGKAGAVGKPGASDIFGNRVECRVMSVGGAVILSPVRQIVGFVRALDAENQSLMAMVPDV